jgi:hypothetical protein
MDTGLAPGTIAFTSTSGDVPPVSLNFPVVDAISPSRIAERLPSYGVKLEM